MIPGFFDKLFFSFLKILFVFAALLYVCFAGVVVRQIVIMEKSLLTSFSKILRHFGYAHFFIAVAVAIFFVMVL